MSEAKFKLTAVCGGCRWLSGNPQQACIDCGSVICPKCGEHCWVVARWPGESDDVVGRRYNYHLVQLREQFLNDEAEGDGPRH